MHAGQMATRDTAPEFSKDCFGLDQCQARLYTAIVRHAVLVMATLARTSGRVLVVASLQRDPVLSGQCASGRADRGELLKVVLAGRAGREQDQHPGWRTALVGESVNPAPAERRESRPSPRRSRFPR